jgi:thiol-disulfide isomerase/thioredoxin
LAARAYAAYPSEENAREWAGALVKAGREEEAMTHLAEAFSIPDPHTTEVARLDDRIRLGEIYSKLHGSEKGLGDMILSAYDRTATLMEGRRKKLIGLDPNAAVVDPMDFTVTGLDGKKLKLGSLRGKVVVLDFWATWCEPCRTQHPMYEELKKFFGNRGDVAFLGMDTDEDRSLVEPFLAKQMWDKTVYYEDGLARLLQVTSIPTTILFDKRGHVASRMNGFVPDTFMEQMKGRIQAALDDLGSAQ